MTSAGIVLAAGASRRMGKPKQLLPVAGRPLLERIVGEAGASSLDDVVVILGASAARIKESVNFGRARVVLNEHHEAGMSTSLQAGVATLHESTGRAVVILGDQPAVTAEQLDQLLELQASSGLPAAAFSFGGLLHPPVVLDRQLWPDLLTLTGDVGCRALIRARPELVAPLPMTDAGRHPVDIDTREDYFRLLATHHNGDHVT